MNVVVLILAALTALSFALSIWQFVLAMRFPLHRREPVSGALPGVSILKPLHGRDAETEECLRSWMAMGYAGPMEILFGVGSKDDPVCETVWKLIQQHPNRTARLVVCAERRGANPKLSKLVQLAPLAAHEVICVGDADVRVPPDFLSQVIASLGPEVGLVNCFYRFSGAGNFAMRCEAFAVNADFWAQVLQAMALKPMDFALGGVMVASRQQLEAIGGFSALADYLADDYELGHRIARTGARVVLSSVVVECRTVPMRAAEVWSHQLRWARTIRVSRPGPYLLSILGNGTLWPVWLAAVQPTGTVLAAAGVALVWRMAQGFLQERRMTGRGRVDSLWLAPLKDLLQVALWVAAFAGREVVWRGERMRVGSDGRLKAR